MMTDIFIMAYVLLMALLIFQAEKLPQNSLKVVIIGIFLSPIIGFGILTYYQKQLDRSFE